MNIQRFSKGGAKGRPLNDEALQRISELIPQQQLRRDLLIENLHLIQDRYGYLSNEHIVALAALMNLPMTEVYEVASFYHHFDLVKDDENAPPELTVRVCDSVSCAIRGSESLSTRLSTYFGGAIRVQNVPCVGRCADAPVVVVGQNPIANATEQNVQQAVQSAATTMPAIDTAISYADYCKDDGYNTFKSVQTGKRTGDSVIETLTNSGLRGLGGAGFPVGRKWSIVRSQPAPRLIAVNIDEGEPGTFKDRYYLEKDPHRFLEGLLIAHEVVKCDAIYIYVRDEYPHCRQILINAVEELRAAGFSLPLIEIRRGAGAYICGEESAMIESIEGKRGMPRLRPPFVAEVGLFGRPTLEHNFESLYWVRELLEKGAEWFAHQGRHERKGLRSFSVSGRVNNPGVHLAPAGITLNELIDEYCGGMETGHTLKGYFPGGASGGILPASKADIPLDFDTLQPYGSFIGSAAIIVLSDKDSIRDAALNAMRFFKHESCGKCTPCRVGTTKATALMEQDRWDANLLNELATVMMDASICGLGQAAPNPLLSVLKHFPEELK